MQIIHKGGEYLVSFGCSLDTSWSTKYYSIMKKKIKNHRRIEVHKWLQKQHYYTEDAFNTELSGSQAVPQLKVNISLNSRFKGR